MISVPQSLARLQFLARVATKEGTHLQSTDQRLFAERFTELRARSLDDDPDLAERVEAFVGRFGRLQDTLADKLLPVLLSALGKNRAHSWTISNGPSAWASSPRPNLGSPCSSYATRW